jgi:hypothetical protein
MKNREIDAATGYKAQIFEKQGCFIGQISKVLIFTPVYG